MNIARFEDLVDRHGEDIATWPVALRGEAEAFVAGEPAAKLVLERARGLRAAFAEAPPIRAPRDLGARILLLAEASDRVAGVERAPARPQPQPSMATVVATWIGDLLPRLRPAHVLAACFVAGLVLGLTLVDPAATQTASNDEAPFTSIIR